MTPQTTTSYSSLYEDENEEEKQDDNYSLIKSESDLPKFETKDFNSSFASLKALQVNSNRRSRNLSPRNFCAEAPDEIPGVLTLPPPMDAQGYFIKPESPPISRKVRTNLPETPPRLPPRSPVPPPRPPRRS